MRDLPKRKPNRLKEYDYSQNGACFITTCVKDRHELLWNAGALIVRPQDAAPLSEYGITIEAAVFVFTSESVTVLLIDIRYH